MNEELFYKNLGAVCLIVIGMIKGENWVENDCIPYFDCKNNKDKDWIWTILYGIYACIIFVIGWGWFIANDPCPLDVSKYIAIPIVCLSVWIQYNYKSLYTPSLYNLDILKHDLAFKIMLSLLFVLTLSYLIVKSLRLRKERKEREEQEMNINMNINLHSVLSNCIGFVFILLSMYMYHRLRKRSRLSSWWQNYYHPFSTSIMFLCFGFVLLAIGNSVTMTL